MIRRQGIRAKFKSRQQGAVAIIVAICLVVLIGMLGLVLDLGHLYVAKSELQNAADAAALSGAKELDGTKDGIDRAKAAACAVGGMNEFDLSSKPVANTSGNPPTCTNLILSVGYCPNTGCMSPIASINSDALAADKTFLEVNTGSRNFDTWFIHVFSEVMSGMQTLGVAVAGRYSTLISPMAVCAIDKSRNEQGFVRGVAYNIPDMNPISKGDPIWINPVDSYPGPCEQNHGNTPTMTPYVCTGKSATIKSIPGDVWVNTGAQAALTGPLNSRFGDNYTGGQACDPESAPPDENVKEFVCTQANNPNKDNNCPNNAGANAPETWMDTVNTTNQLVPYHQTIEVLNSPQGKPFNYPARLSTEIPSNFSRYGVLWSYSREVKDFTTDPYTNYQLSDWPALYGGSAETSFPTSSPYLTYIEQPSGAGAPYKKADRRVLNVAIIDCAGVTSIPGQQCNMHLPVLAIGKFFMQRRAQLPDQVSGEFAGVLPTPLPPGDIRLYR